MSFLEKLEKLSEKYIEGLFKGKGTDHIQPVEMAKKISREMRDGKTISVSKVYVPNSYTVYLAPLDWELYEAVTGSLAKDLVNYVVTKAAEKKYILVGKPVINFSRDDQLKTGECRVNGRFIEAPAKEQEPAAKAGVEGAASLPSPPAPAPAVAAPAATGPAVSAGPGLAGLSAASAGAAPALPATAAAPPSGVTGIKIEFGAPVPKTSKNPEEDTLIAQKGALAPPLITEETITAPKPLIVGYLEVKEGAAAGKVFPIPASTVTIGRLQQNDVYIPDTNVSRRHARLEYMDGEFLLSDLGSTNGTFVNEERVSQSVLDNGDSLRVGKTLLLFRVD